MAVVLSAHHLAKRFGTRQVLTDVSVTVDERDRLAIVGVNGSGKSTLLRLLASELGGDELDAGEIMKRRGLRLAYVPQEPDLDRRLTILDALSKPFGTEATPHEAQAMADVFGLFEPGRTLGELSIGEFRRVALAQALLSDADVLALDEPTNHLDATTIDLLETRLQQYRGAILLVTHDRYFLDRVATRIAELDRGTLHLYGKGYDRFIEQQAERLKDVAERDRLRRSFIRNELDWIRRGPKARTTKSQDRIDRFDAAVAAEAESDRLGPEERAIQLRLPSGPRLGKTVLEANNISKSIDGRLLFADFSLILRPGVRIGIIGPNGAGKSTLVRTLVGAQAPDSGSVKVGHNTRFAVMEQSRETLDGDLTVLEAVAGEGDQVFLGDGPVHVSTYLRMMMFDDEVARQPVRKLSGGERNRLQLTKLLTTGGNVIVLDEPTNDLDLITLGILERALVGFPGSALIVSHDRWFLDNVATAILAFEEGGRVTLYEGNYSDWARAAAGALRRRERNHNPEEAPTLRRLGSSDGDGKGLDPADGRRMAPAPGPRLTYKEQKELESISEAIESAEGLVSTLEDRLNDPTLYAERASEAAAVIGELETARARVDDLYRRWEALEAKRAASGR